MYILIFFSVIFIDLEPSEISYIYLPYLPHLKLSTMFFFRSQNILQCIRMSDR